MARRAIAVQITGVKRLDRKFARLPKRVQNRVVRTSIKDAAKILMEDSRRRAPKLTGALKKGHKVRAMKRRRNFIGRTILVDDPAAAAMEYGTSDVDAQPYLRPALDETGQRVKDKALANIKRGIIGEAKRL